MTDGHDAWVLLAYTVLRHRGEHRDVDRHTAIEDMMLDSAWWFNYVLPIAPVLLLCVAWAIVWWSVRDKKRPPRR